MPIGSGEHCQQHTLKKRYALRALLRLENPISARIVWHPDNFCTSSTTRRAHRAKQPLRQVTSGACAEPGRKREHRWAGGPEKGGGDSEENEPVERTLMCGFVIVVGNQLDVKSFQKAVEYL